MTRFEPESWREALLRPLAMAAPDGGVYVEFIAPDFRFVFALLLLVALLVHLRSRRGRATPVLALGTLMAVSFVPWMATTGNGRYFLPILLLAGPLCIGLLQLLPWSRGARLLVAVGMVAWQGYLVQDANPLRSWTFVHWGEGAAFEVDVPEDMVRSPATYVSLATISYSLIAPRFHPDSRWINVSSQHGVGDPSRDGQRTQAFLRQGEPLRVIFPTPPQGASGTAIEPALQVAIDDLLVRHGLSIADAAQCRLLRSGGLRKMAVRERSDDGQLVNRGFWVCPLARQAKASDAGEPIPVRTEEVFRKMERTCPGLFRPTEATTQRIPAGAMRVYPGTDFKLYVLNDGTVIYKYWRALNAETLGTVDAVLAESFRMDCSRIRGRTGLPWERQI